MTQAVCLRSECLICDCSDYFPQPTFCLAAKERPLLSVKWRAVAMAMLSFVIRQALFYALAIFFPELSPKSRFLAIFRKTLSILGCNRPIMARLFRIAAKDKVWKWVCPH